MPVCDGVVLPTVDHAIGAVEVTGSDLLVFVQLQDGQSNRFWCYCITVIHTLKSQEDTRAGWVSVSEVGRLYGRSRKWVYDQIDRYQISTEKEENRTRFRLVDPIAHRGEPSNGAPQTNGTHSEQGQIITPENRVMLAPKKLGYVDI